MAMAGGASVLLHGCADDSGGGAGTDGETDSDGTTNDPSMPTTSSSSPSSTDPDGTGTGTTAEESSGESSSSSDTDEPPGDCEVEGEVIEFDPDAIPSLENGELPLAVMAGEMKPESVMLTVWVADGTAKTLRVWQPGEREGTVLLVHEEVVTPLDEGYIKVTVDGLCPGQWYRYAWFTDDFSGRSVIGNVRTAIAEDALEPLTLAVTCCNGGSLNWPSMHRMAENGFDMLLHLGDMAYNDGATSLEQYRLSWREYMAADGYKVGFSTAGMYCTWDDHEIDDNSNFDRETMDPEQLEKRQNAMDAFFELLPVDAEGPDYVLWRSFRWGLTAEIIVLDCRYERRPSQGLYISPEQMAFLKDRLLNSPCQFKLVMNSVPITNMPNVWDVAANDRWEGYPTSRNDIRDYINENAIDNVWFLGGDFHVCFVSRLEPTGEETWDRVREIACSGGNTNPVPAGVLGLGSAQFDYGITGPRGVILQIDPDANTLNVRMLNVDTGDDEFNQTYTFGV
jgi:phosphodiesterase/alkaline phosphatase D-like protein